MDGFGTGLAALAFWGFIAAIMVAGVWDGAKKREAQHETLRRLIDGGKPVDEALMTKLMGGEKKRPDRDLRISAIIVFSVAAGITVLAAFLNQMNPRTLMPLLGAAGLITCVGVGLLVASAYVRRSLAEDDPPGRNSPHVS
jgi:hypothetical protein